MRFSEFYEARTLSEPWGKSPYHDLEVLSKDLNFAKDFNILADQIKALHRSQLASIPRGDKIREILIKHNYQPYKRLVEMLLQRLKNR